MVKVVTSSQSNLAPIATADRVKVEVKVLRYLQILVKISSSLQSK